MADVTRKVGRFEILREVGRGGMAAVYLARQTDLDRFVALKELPAFHAADSDFAERFLRESRIAGSLSHPNIVTVHDYFDVAGTPYISMEYLERGSLRPHMQGLTLPQVAGVLEGLLAALDHAHARGIVHRDLKPENLLLTRQGSVKVADFGIAKAINQASQVNMLTATGTTVGTPTYMAPEQAMAREIVPATDLYSVGVMAYEMLVGRVPFENAETPLAVLLRHVTEAPPPALSINPSLDPGLAHWVENLLEKDPRNRPPSAEAAWDSLEELVLALVGPRWRREARLLDPGEGVTPKPLTPAPFPVPVDAVGAPPVSEFLTYGGTAAPAVVRPQAPAAAAAPAAPPAPPPVPPAPPAETVVPPPMAPTAAPPAVTPVPAQEPVPPVAEPVRPAAQPGDALPVPLPPSEAGYQTFEGSELPTPVQRAATSPPAADALPIPAPTDGYQTFDAAPAEPAPPPPPPPPPPPEPEPEPEVEPEPEPEPEQEAEPAVAAEPTPAPAPKAKGKAKAKQPAKPERTSTPETVPERAPEPDEALAANLTLAPSSVPLGQSFAWPAARTETPVKRKVPLIAWLGLLVVLGGGAAAAAAFLTGGGSSKTETTTAAAPQTTASTPAKTTPTTQPIADVTIPAMQQIGLLGSGGALYLVTPRGYIARLNAKTLAPEQVATDGARPRALAVSGSRLVVASAGGVSALARGTLQPVAAATALSGARFLAGGDGAPVVAIGSSRACLVDPATVACGPLGDGFGASGAGVVRADSSVVVADAAAGTVMQMRRKGDRLVASEPIAAGPGAHGPLLSFSGRLYVPIRRGLAVVDLAGKAKTTVIALPSSPAEVWISPAGRLFATLPASNGVAVVDLAGASRAVRVVPVGKRPQGIAGVAGSVYVANTGAGTVSRLSAASGDPAGGAASVSLLRKPLISPTVATSVAKKAGAAAVAFTVAFTGPPLARRDVRATATAIRSGQARFTLWRDGVRSSARPASAGGATLAVGGGSGRLTFALSSKANAFTAVKASLTGGGHKLVLTLTPVPEVKTPVTTSTPTTNNPSSSTPTTSTPSTPTTSTPTTTTPKTTKPPKKTTPPKTTTGPEIG